MRALVTGSAGFIGSHVVRRLLARGVEVRALHLPTDDLRNLEGLEVERITGDVTDAAAMARACRGVDQVFHLAAIYALWMRDPSRMTRVNVEGTRTVLGAAREAGVRRVVVTSSIARFGGQGPGRRATEASPFALGATGDVYSRSKAEAHAVAEEAARRGQDVVICAPTGPIGPGDVGPTPTGRLLLALFSLPVVPIVRTASNFADVRDIAEGHVLAAEKGRTGESYLLGHVDLSARELAAIGAKVLGVHRPVVEVPTALAERFGRASVALAERRGIVPFVTPEAARIARLELIADCRKAVLELGMPQTPIEVAVADAIAWFRAQGMLDPRRLVATAR